MPVGTGNASRPRAPARVYSVKAAARASKPRSLGRGDRLVRRGLCDRAASLYCALPVTGGMAEWLKALAWKACIRETVSWVRIPLPPPAPCSHLFAFVQKTTLESALLALCS